MEEAKQLINWERFGYSVELWQTPIGYLLAWNDYVANSWIKGFETLGEALELLTKIEQDSKN